MVIQNAQKSKKEQNRKCEDMIVNKNAKKTGQDEGNENILHLHGQIRGLFCEGDMI